MDVGDILGLSRPSATSQEEQIKLLLDDSSNKQTKSNSKNKTKPKGMSRELFALMGPDGAALAPSIQTNQPNLFKDKRQHAMHGRWVWSSFRNSSRRFHSSSSHLTTLTLILAMIYSALIGSRPSFKAMIILMLSSMSRLSRSHSKIKNTKPFFNIQIGLVQKLIIFSSFAMNMIFVGLLLLIDTKPPHLALLKN
jgi:hypothetical protein